MKKNKYLISKENKNWCTVVWKILEDNGDRYKIKYIGEQFPFHCIITRMTYISNFPKELVERFEILEI